MRDLLGLVAACGGVKEEEKQLKRTPGLPSWDHSQSQECLGWSGELVDLGHVWAEVLPVRCQRAVYGVETQTQAPSRVVAWLRPSQAESAEQAGYKLRRRPAE